MRALQYFQIFTRRGKSQRFRHFPPIHTRDFAVAPSLYYRGFMAMVLFFCIFFFFNESHRVLHAHSLNHAFVCSLGYSFTFSLIRLFTYSLLHLPLHLLCPSLPHSHSYTRSFTHSLIRRQSHTCIHQFNILTANRRILHKSHSW